MLVKLQWIWRWVKSLAWGIIRSQLFENGFGGSSQQDLCFLWDNNQLEVELEQALHSLYKICKDNFSTRSDMRTEVYIMLHSTYVCETSSY